MDEFKFYMRHEFGTSYAIRSRNAQATITGVGEKHELDNAVAELREKDPDGYANLSEHLPLEDYGKEADDTRS